MQHKYSLLMQLRPLMSTGLLSGFVCEGIVQPLALLKGNANLTGCHVRMRPWWHADAEAARLIPCDSS